LLLLNKIIDQTMLKPDASKQDLESFLEEAVRYDFICVALLPNVIREASAMLRGTGVHVMAAISYPRGMVPIHVKKIEIEEALSDGADEIDMVLNLEAIKNHAYGIIEKELSVLRETARSLTVKAILETTLLSDEEIVQVCQLASNIGVDFVKTSTGFRGNRATIHAVEVMKQSVFNQTCVKAAGGINNLSKLIQMLEAGASRIGTSAGPAIIEEFKRSNINLEKLLDTGNGDIKQ